MSVPELEFFSSRKEENFSHVRRGLILVLFGSTYVCKETYSVIKPRYRSLLSALTIATPDIQSDFNALT